jgi:acyl carrier protein
LRATEPEPGTPDPAAIESVEGTIRTFLSAHSPAGRGGPHRLAAHRSLWRDVDSLTLLQLVAFVEQKFSIKVRPIDFAPQNFSTIAAIARFVVARRPRTAES